MFALGTLFFLLLHAPGAASPSDAAALFAHGDYYKARDAARDGMTADHAFLACRSGLVIGGFYERGAMAVHSLHGAIEDCERAIIQNHKHWDARLSLALGVAFEGKRLKSVKLVKLSKQVLTQILEEDPNNPSAYGALAGWHAAVSDAGALARLATGARRSIARKYFVRAYASDPDNLPMAFEYAKFLAGRGITDRSAALAILAAIRAAEPQNNFEQFLQGHARALTEALKKGRSRAVKHAIRRGTAFSSMSRAKEIDAYKFGIGLELALGRQNEGIANIIE